MFTILPSIPSHIVVLEAEGVNLSAGPVLVQLTLRGYSAITV